MTAPKTFLFGYGSLIDRENLAAFLARLKIECRKVAEGSLRGYRRTWNVAMNNRIDILGYKYYVDPQTGERPPIFVTFINIRESAEDFCNGVIFEVPESALPEFDQRERNYRRINVSDRFEPKIDGTVWAYIARDEGIARYEEGVRNNTAVIHRQYISAIENAFRAGGDAAFAAYCDSTDAPEVPIRDLKRIDLPR